MKKTMFTRIIASVLCLGMLCGLLTGCGGKGKKVDESDENTITIGLMRNALIEDYETNAFTKWLEETTGYNIKFHYFSNTEFSSQLSTMIAGGEKLPDILWAFEISSDVYSKYGEQGYFLNLAPYFEDKEKSSVFWSRIEELYPEDFKNAIATKLYHPGTKDIWAVPRIECTMIDTMDYQVFINQKWLDKLGLAMPTDPDSLYNVLKQFVTKDPNGNGKADEIGIIGRNNQDTGRNAVGWLMNMFVNVGHTDPWNIDSKGQLYLPQLTNEYRNGLIYINKLVKEGLMPDTCWSMNDNDVRTLLTPADGVNRVGVWVGHPSISLSNGDKACYEYAAMPLWGYAVENENFFDKRSFITSDCKNPDAAWEIFMAMCSEEGSRRMRYGEKGVDWDDADEGTTSFLGLPAEIKIINELAFSTQGNQTWGRIDATVLVNAEHEVTQLTEDTDEWLKFKYNLMKTYRDNFENAKKAKKSVIANHIRWTLKQVEETETESSSCQTWISTNSASFCCGTNNMDPNKDADWKKYLEGFDNLGYKKWRDQAQKLYDEQYK